MKYQIYIFLTICLFSTSLSGQISFSNESTTYFGANDGFGAVPVAIADVNADGLDDIVRISNNRLEIMFQKLDGSYTFSKYNSLPVHSYSILVANLDPDAQLEIVIGTASGVYLINVFPTYSIQQIQTNILPQCMNAIDINGDTQNDIFISNDVGQNVCLINNGNGTFTNEIERFAKNSDDVQEQRGNYGSVFSDVDNDGDMDLFITKCNPNAPAGHKSRINILYLNDGTGHYNIAPDSWGVNSDDQSWAADFGDYDLDGDMDLVVVNHGSQHKLYRNDGGIFTDMSDSISLGETTSALEVKWVDFDNDGLLDILVTGEEHVIYHNEGAAGFKRVANPFGLYRMLSFGLGDFNRDGKTDVYATYGSSITQSSTIPDRLFLNTSPEHGGSFYGLRVLDYYHHEAIGARVTLYTNNHTYIREVRAGDSYGIVNSNLLIFRLTKDETIDSLRIRWISGYEYTLTRKKFYESEFLNTGYFWTYAEDKCQSPSLYFSVVDDKYQFCEGDSAIAYLDGNGSYLFTTDTVFSDFKKVVKSDQYLGAVAIFKECKTFTPLYAFDLNPEQSVSLELHRSDLYCHGDNIEVTVSGDLPIIAWNDGSTARVKNITEDQTVYAQVQGLCQELTTDTFQLNFLIPALPITYADTIAKDSVAHLLATGDSIWWYKNPTDLIPYYMGSKLETENLSRTDTFYARNVVITGSPIDTTGKRLAESNPGFGSTSLNGGIFFDAEQDLVLHSVTVQTTQSFERNIILMDVLANVVASKVILIDSGTQLLPLDFTIPAGKNYFLTTDPVYNLPHTGDIGPNLTRDREGVHFGDYNIDGLITLTTSSLGADYYFYFFDWLVSTPQGYCLSETVPAIAYVVRGVANRPAVKSTIESWYADHTIYVKASVSGTTRLTISSMSGTKIYTAQKNVLGEAVESFNIGALPPAMYIFTLTLGGENYFSKVIIN